MATSPRKTFWGTISADARAGQPRRDSISTSDYAAMSEKMLVDAARRGVYHVCFDDFAKDLIVTMSTQNRISVSDVGETAVVNFADSKILDEANIQEMGRELFSLVESDRKQILLNFSKVEFLSSAALGKLITLDKKVKSSQGKLRLSNIRPEIYEVFAITRLNKLFEIHDDEADALASF
jgi:anti-sigma B factor antagonist